MTKRLVVLATVSLAIFITACGDDGQGYGEQNYADKANSICASVGGAISYSYGESYDVVICKDGVVHEIEG